MEYWRREGKSRIEVLNNGQYPAPNTGCSIQISRTPLKDRNIFAYIGNMGIAQGMDILLDLADHLRQRDDIGFIFVGRGSEAGRLKARAETERLSNVIFFDAVPSTEIPGLLAQCRVGLLADRKSDVEGKRWSARVETE